MSEETMARICPQCKREVSVTAKFCNFCGNPLPPVPAASPDPAPQPPVTTEPAAQPPVEIPPQPPVQEAARPQPSVQPPVVSQPTEQQPVQKQAQPSAPNPELVDYQPGYRPPAGPLPPVSHMPGGQYQNNVRPGIQPKKVWPIVAAVAVAVLAVCIGAAVVLSQMLGRGKNSGASRVDRTEIAESAESSYGSGPAVEGDPEEILGGSYEEEPKYLLTTTVAYDEEDKQLYRIEYEYDEQGVERSATYYDENDEYYFSVSSVKDAAGNIVGRKYHDKNDDTVYFTEEMEYDRYGNVVAFREYNRYNDLTEHWEAEYDANGNRLGRWVYDEDDELSAYYETYEVDGEPAGWYIYDGDGNKFAYTEEDRDENGNVTWIGYYSVDGEYLTCESFIFDEDGHQTGYIDYDYDDNITDNWWSYYDENGNEEDCWFYSSDDELDHYERYTYTLWG